LQTFEGKQAVLEQMYKQIVLLGLTSPYSLSPEDLWRTHDYVSRFAGFAALTPVTDTRELQEGYWVTRSAREPANVPASSNGDSNDAAYLLDLSQFVDNLLRHINGVKSGEPLRLVGMERLQRKTVLDLLTQLHRNWTRNPERKSPRQAIDEQIGMVW